MREQFKSQSSPAGSVSIRLLIVFAVAIVATVLLIRSASPARQISTKQAALLQAIEKRSRSGVEKLIAADYSDRWSFDKDDVVLAFLDVGSQFIVLAVEEIDASTEFADADNDTRSAATVTSRLQIAGSGGPVAQLVIRRNNQLKTPFSFTWQKQSWWPGSWRLIRIDNEEVPENLEGYEPGDIRRAMSFE